MTAGFSPPGAAGLRERLDGRVVLPGDEEYDAGRCGTPATITGRR